MKHAELIEKCLHDLAFLNRSIEKAARFTNNHHPMVTDEETENILHNAGAIAGIIDHTLLKADGTPEQVIELCREARENGFFSVCVNSVFVSLAKKELAGSPVELAVVVGFPLGAMSPQAKAFETAAAVGQGATEVDMVISVGLLKAGQYDAVLKDIKGVVDAAGDKAAVKVIIETCLLNDEEKVKACLLSLMAGAEFVKTSTGFSTGGATVEDIALMREVVGNRAGVKASGGVRTTEDARAMVKAGANRIGASASLAIIGK